jgi:hypothetical protein
MLGDEEMDGFQILLSALISSAESHHSRFVNFAVSAPVDSGNRNTSGRITHSQIIPANNNFKITRRLSISNLS